MPKIPESVTKEQYLLKSTFFYNKLKTSGYFELFMQVQKFSQVEGKNLNWDDRASWNISEEAWNILKDTKIAPELVFVHPKVLRQCPTHLKYYRSVAMIPQKGLKSIAHVSNIDAIEEGKVDPNKISKDSINKLVNAINEVLSLVITLSSDLSNNELQGMMYATAGTNIDGSWRNQIGAEGERVIRSIILKELYLNKEVTSITNKNSEIISIKECDLNNLLNNIDSVKAINLVNSYYVIFSSEPDVTMYDKENNIVGIVEIKSGLDPAGALERLGAMLKSFKNTLDEYPDAITILVASCITEEVSNRLNASRAVSQTYITTRITSNDSEKRKFVNNLRVIMKLAKSSI